MNKKMDKHVVRTLLIIFFLAAISTPAFSAYDHYAVRINCGGDEYEMPFSNIYVADCNYTGGSSAGFAGGDIYASRRKGVFGYAFDVPSGFYNIKLHFMETEADRAGLRKLSAYIEGTTVISNIDVYSEAGGKYIALDYEFLVQVDDGQLNVDIDFGNLGFLPYPAMLNAISVTKVKPQSTGPVQISGRQILVNGQPFTIKGAGYQPVPVGENLMGAKFEIFANPGIYNRDIPLLRAMNCNVIRTWGKVAEDEEYIGGPFTPAIDFLDACWNGGTDPIYVAMGFHPWNQANIDPDNPSNVRQDIIDEFKVYVNTYKDHPAVLMWSVGNENNYWQSSSSWDPTMTHEELMQHWYSLVNELAWAAYEVEGNSYHPVTVVNGDIWNSTGPIGNPDFNTDDDSMLYLDVWGANIYSGWSFQGRIQNYMGLSSKPFWIPEYGFPGTDQRNQAEGACVLWDEMARAADICSGGTIMEYSDEWWKSGYPDRHDDSFGVEFFGVVAVEDNGEGHDIMHPKLAYFTLQEQWASGAVRNIAFGKNAYASSDEGGQVAGNAVDGDRFTRWSSEASDPQWIYIDLGETHDIGRVVLQWEAAYASGYEIQVSDNASDWITVYSTSAGDGYTDFIYLDDTPVTGRYVRMYGTQRGTAWGYSLWEFEVYEPLQINAARDKTASASSVEGPDNPDYTADHAVDGDYNTRWSSEHSDPQWISVDLGAEFDITQVILRWEAAYASEYRIQVSDDAINWMNVYYTANGDGGDDYITFNFPVSGRYVRVYCMQRATTFGYSLWEFEVITGNMYAPAEPPLIKLIDNFNDSDPNHNSLGSDNWWGSWDSTGVFDVEQAYLHKYDPNLLKDNNALKFTYDCSDPDFGGWYKASLWDYATFLDIADFDYLSFRMKRESGSEMCYVRLYYGKLDETEQETNLLYVPNYAVGTVTDEWQLVNIPLSHFSGLDINSVRTVAFVFRYDADPFANNGTIYIDNLEFSQGYGKLEGTGPVRIDRATKTLYVDGQPFTVKGVGYQPLAIGDQPPDPIDALTFDRDFPLLVDMGCNTVRTWGQPGLELMNKAEEYGLKVIVGFYMPDQRPGPPYNGVDYTDPTVRENIKSDFTDFVNIYKDKSALLMWAIGNENNYQSAWNESYYSLANELAEIAYEIEGASYHPAIIVNGKLLCIGVDEQGADDMQLNYIDAWGANLYAEEYSNCDWLGDNVNIFNVYKEKSSKPLIITEYGADAYYTTSHEPVVIGYEDQDAQADWTRENTIEILAQDVCLGGVIMEYSDEWWKYSGGLPTEHDNGGFDPLVYDPNARVQPDDYVNEEYFGIVEIATDGTWDTPDGLDDIRTRKVYDTLKLIFEGAEVVEPGESIQAAIDSASSGDIIYLIDGTFDYEDNITIEDKDNIKLLGDGAGDTVIKGTVSFKNSDSSIEKLSVLYKDGGNVSYSNSYYSDFELLKDAGITVIDSDVTVKDCIIMPDPDIFGGNNYGKGVQIWNMYGSQDTSPLLENNLIQKADTGIYLYSQSFGGAVNGTIQDNDLRDNTYGIILRMHKEKPLIDGNTISGSLEDGIHITYDDGTLLTDRLSNISNNHFISNSRDVFCDELGTEVIPTGAGNTYE